MTARHSIARRAALTLAILMAFAGTSLAAGSYGNKVNVTKAVKANRAKRGASTRVKVRAIRPSKSGKSIQVLSAVEGGHNQVEAYNVDKATGTARRTKTGLVTQHQAASKANNRARRERAPHRGTFSGVAAEGLTRAGNYAFASQTDKTERFFVSPTTGRTVKREK